jgi:hypothetical protein
MSESPRGSLVGSLVGLWFGLVLAACGGGNNSPTTDSAVVADGNGLPLANTTLASVSITSLPGASMNTGAAGVFSPDASAAGSGTAPALSNTIVSAFPGAPAKPIFVSQTAAFDSVIVTVQGRAGFFAIPAGTASTVVGLDVVAAAAADTGNITLQIATQLGTAISLPTSLTYSIDPHTFIAAGDLENHDDANTNIADLFAAFLEGFQGNPAMPMQVLQGHNNNDDEIGGVKGLVGPVATGHREVVWDGVPEALRNATTFSPTFFDRQVGGTEGVQSGIIFTATGGTGEEVNDALAGVLPDPAVVGPPDNPNTNLGGDFSNLNPAYAGDLIAFTQNAEFAPIGTTTTDVTFHVAASTTKGFVTGFGVVFTSVDKAQASSIELFDVNNTSIVKIFAPLKSTGPFPFAGPVAASAGNIPFSFVGYIDKTARIARVRMTNGESPINTGNDMPGQRDVVAIDDIYFSEPRP